MLNTRPIAFLFAAVFLTLLAGFPAKALETPASHVYGVDGQKRRGADATRIHEQADDAVHGV